MLSIILYIFVALQRLEYIIYYSRSLSSDGSIVRDRGRDEHIHVLFDHGAWPIELITVNWQLPRCVFSQYGEVTLQRKIYFRWDAIVHLTWLIIHLVSHILRHNLISRNSVASAYGRNRIRMHCLGTNEKRVTYLSYVRNCALLCNGNKFKLQLAHSLRHIINFNKNYN